MKTMKNVEVPTKEQLKGMTQLELVNGIRRALHLPTRVERPSKGGGYRRPQGNWKKFLDKD